MSEIKIVRQIERSKLDEIGAFDWPVWSKEVSTFDWFYDSSETCYFLAGDVVVTPKGGVPVEMGKGDLVTFPSGMACTWEIRGAVKKHYSFE